MGISSQPVIHTSVLTAVDLSAKTTVGTRAHDELGNEYIYLKGVASTVLGSWVNYYPNDYTTKLSTEAETAKFYPLAVAMAATVASRWGWYQVYGLATAFYKASAAVDAALYMTTTAGQADDAGTTLVDGAKNLTVVGGAAATSPTWIQHPTGRVS